MICNDMKNGAVINNVNLYFNTKSDIKENSFIQKHLKNYKQGNTKCICKGNNSPLLSVRTINNKYYLATFPNTSDKHDKNCLFYSALEKLEDTNGNYKNPIFQEVPQFKNKSSDNKYNSDFEKKETQRKNTFYNFCRDLISESTAFAFNITNKEYENKSLLKNFKANDFYNSINILINRKNLFFTNKTIKESLPDNYSLVYGICDDKLFTQISDKPKLICKKIQPKIENGKLIKWELKDRNYSIDKKRLSIAKNLIRNYNNLINAPYFFMATIKKITFKNKNDENISYWKAIRLFIHPIYFNDDKICFVESNYERKYAAFLYANQVPFVKPITNREYFKINNSILPEKLQLQYRPDFIELHRDIIKITEVSGYDDEEYQELLQRKKVYYESICFNKYSYQEVKGSTIF